MGSGQRREMGLDSLGLLFLLLQGQGGLIWGLSASPHFPVKLTGSCPAPQTRRECLKVSNGDL